MPSSSPLPLAVVWRPNAQALEPSGESSRPASRMASAASARFSGNSVVVAAAVAAGGLAASMASASATMPACDMVVSCRRAKSAAVIGCTQGWLLQAAGSWPAWSARKRL